MTTFLVVGSGDEGLSVAEVLLHSTASLAGTLRGETTITVCDPRHDSRYDPWYRAEFDHFDFDCVVKGGLLSTFLNAVPDDDVLAYRAVLSTPVWKMANDLLKAAGVSLGCIRGNQHINPKYAIRKSITSPIIGASVLRDGVRLGSLVRIGHGCWIGENVVIGSGVVVKDGSVIEPGSVLAPRSEVNEYATVGFNSVVQKGVRVGREAEVPACSVVSQDVADGEIFSEPDRSSHVSPCP